MMAIVVMVEVAMGRTLWGRHGVPGFWDATAHSPHNSEFALDPYTIMHVSEGGVTYGIVRLVSRHAPVARIGLIVAGVGSAWEIFENSDFIMNRYRVATMSRDYYGDSIVNSMFDILAGLVGFWLVAKLPWQVSLVGIIALEILLMVWTRDSLLLNIIMLLTPINSIKAWQQAA